MEIYMDEDLLKSLSDDFETGEGFGDYLWEMYGYIFDRCGENRQYSFARKDSHKEFLAYECAVHNIPVEEVNLLNMEEDSYFFEVLRLLHKLYVKRKDGIVTVHISKKCHDEWKAKHAA